LCQQAALEWQQQQQQVGQQQQEQQQDAAVAKTPALSALMQLLTADGLLLPASGEVLVSARALAQALTRMPVGLQQRICCAWREHLLQEQAPAETPAAASMPGTTQQQPSSAAGVAAVQQAVLVPSVPRLTLQPMLCLLNHLGDLNTQPFARVLGDAVCVCLLAAAAAGARPASSAVRDILKHVLLPIRFKLQVPARVWVLQQLLCPVAAGSSTSAAGLSAVDATAGSCGATTGTAAQGVGEGVQGVAGGAVWEETRQQVLQVLGGMLAGECSVQLAQGMKALASEQEALSKGAAQSVPPAAVPGPARDLADTLVQFVLRLQGQSVPVDAAGGGSGSGGAAAGVPAGLTVVHAAVLQHLRAAAGDVVCTQIGLL
jgi:hypothetical protein